jgi:hypothetical protein
LIAHGKTLIEKGMLEMRNYTESLAPDQIFASNLLIRMMNTRITLASTQAQASTGTRSGAPSRFAQ